MVFVGVGQHQAGKPVAALFNERRVGRNKVDARRRAVAKRDAEIDH